MRRENIYKHVTSGQEFISRAYMRRELYKRIKIAHDYMVHADKQYYRGEINLNCFLEKINERIAELQYCIWFSEDALIISPEESDSFHEFINKFTLMFVGHCEYVFVKDIFPMEVFDILLSPVSEGVESMKKKLIRNFKQELKKLEKYVDNLNEIVVSGGVNSDDDYQSVLKDAERLYIILGFLNQAEIIGNKKFIIYRSRIREAEHWFLPSTADSEIFM